MYKILIHSGIKGQKWGVRRYQNEDGIWTEEGLRRRRIGNKRHLLNQETVFGKGSHFYRPEVLNRSENTEYSTSSEGKKIYLLAEDQKKAFKSLREDIYNNPEKFMNSKIIEISGELTKDLKAPSAEEQYRVFDEFYKKNKKRIHNDNDLRDQIYGLSDPEDIKEKLYENVFYEGILNPFKGDVGYDFLKYMRKKGYNAFVEPNYKERKRDFQLGYKKPILVMDALNKVGDIKYRELDKYQEQLNILKKKTKTNRILSILGLFKAPA